MNTILALVSGAILGACTCTCTPPPRPPPSPAPDLDATCAVACARLRELECPDAEATPNGASCEAVCENVQGSGIVAWDLSCRARATSCAAVDSCELE